MSCLVLSNLNGEYFDSACCLRVVRISGEKSEFVCLFVCFSLFQHTSELKKTQV